MRVTIEITDELHRQVKAAAAVRGITLGRWMAEALAEKLARDGTGPRKSSASGP